MSRKQLIIYFFPLLKGRMDFQSNCAESTNFIYCFSPREYVTGWRREKKERPFPYFTAQVLSGLVESKLKEAERKQCHRIRRDWLNMKVKT